MQCIQHIHSQYKVCIVHYLYVAEAKINKTWHLLLCYYTRPIVWPLKAKFCLQVEESSSTIRESRSTICTTTSTKSLSRQTLTLFT